MTEFIEVSPEEGSYWTYESGRITVTARQYAFGQYRLQIWYDSGGLLPNILSPEC